MDHDQGAPHKPKKRQPGSFVQIQLKAIHKQFKTPPTKKTSPFKKVMANIKQLSLSWLPHVTPCANYFIHQKQLGCDHGP